MQELSINCVYKHNEIIIIYMHSYNIMQCLENVLYRILDQLQEISNLNLSGFIVDVILCFVFWFSISKQST